MPHWLNVQSQLCGAVDASVFDGALEIANRLWVCFVGMWVFMVESRVPFNLVTILCVARSHTHKHKHSRVLKLCANLRVCVLLLQFSVRVACWLCVSRALLNRFKHNAYDAGPTLHNWFSRWCVRQ